MTSAHYILFELGRTPATGSSLPRLRQRDAAAAPDAVELGGLDRRPAGLADGDAVVRA